MTIQVYREKESGSLSSNRVPYVAYEDDITKTLTRVPAVDAVLAQALIDAGVGVTDYSDRQESNRFWRVEAIYSETRLGKLTLEPLGNVELGFNYQAQAELIYYSHATLFSGGVEPGKSPKFDGLVGVKGGIGGLGTRATGVQVVPRVTNWIRYTVANGTITEAYEQQIGDVMGHVNTITYRGKEAGSLRFVSCTSTIRSDTTMQITFGFDYRPTVEEFRLGQFANSLLIPAHKGHDILWTYDEEYVADPEEEIGLPGFAPRQSVLAIRPVYYYIERVHLFSDFAAELGI